MTTEMINATVITINETTETEITGVQKRETTGTLKRRQVDASRPTAYTHRRILSSKTRRQDRAGTMMNEEATVALKVENQPGMPTHHAITVQAETTVTTTVRALDRTARA